MPMGMYDAILWAHQPSFETPVVSGLVAGPTLALFTKKCGCLFTPQTTFNPAPMTDPAFREKIINAVNSKVSKHKPIHLNFDLNKKYEKYKGKLN